MSTYSALESSVERSRPIELYRITLGAQVFRYTSAEDEITVGAEVFAPESVSRNSIGMSADSRSSNLKINLPASNIFVARYYGVVPGERATLEVLRYQRDEVPPLVTSALLFRGIVQTVDFPNDGHSAEIVVRSLEAALNRNVPRYTYMAMCNHFLFDAKCGINPALYNFIGPAASMVGNVLTVTGAGASGLNFVGGYCRPAILNDFRMVVAQAGDMLTLRLPFSVDVVGLDIQTFAGCDHIATGDCALVFDNVENFGGWPFVPTRNVFQKGIVP